MRKTICGLDEVGRGALAGPLVLASVLLSDDFKLCEVPADIVIRDSKKMTSLQRQKSFEYIVASVLNFKIEVVGVGEINKQGIGVCNKSGFEKLISETKADKYIVDGNIRFEQRNVESVVKADSIYIPVMMAAIVAKVTRDEIMKALHKEFFNYAWNKNVGYGTKEHIQAIRKFGKTIYHRDVFVETVTSKFT